MRRLAALGLVVMSACTDERAPRVGIDEGNLEAAVSLRLASGETVRGVPVAAYDHARWWWDAAAESTFALFEPLAASTSPEQDRSLRFVSRSELAPDQPAPHVSGVPVAYRTWLRSRGVVLDRLPLEGEVHVLNGHERWHLEEGGFGDFAWDLVREVEPGRNYRGGGLAASDYGVWDAEVFLPTAGVVVDVDDGAPDNVPGTIPPGRIQDVKNNLVGVQVAGAYYVYLLHFKQGSIPRAARGTCEPAVPGVRCVEPGAHLEAGTYLGRVGNSGVTYEPHLHVTTYFWDATHTRRSWSVPSELRALYRRDPDGAVTRETNAVPTTGDAISNAPP